MAWTFHVAIGTAASLVMSSEFDGTPYMQADDRSNLYSYCYLCQYLLNTLFDSIRSLAELQKPQYALSTY